MGQGRVFDLPHYDELNRARREVVTGLLAELKDPLQLHTAVDVGCGVGYFSGLLQSLGLAVTGVDGRKGNAEEAARRVPGVMFHTVLILEHFELCLTRVCLTWSFVLFSLSSPGESISRDSKILHALTDKNPFRRIDVRSREHRQHGVA